MVVCVLYRDLERNVMVNLDALTSCSKMALAGDACSGEEAPEARRGDFGDDRCSTLVTDAYADHPFRLPGDVDCSDARNRVQSLNWRCSG